MTDRQLYKLCQEYGRRARKWKNKFVSLLPEVYRRRLYRARGFCSIYEFAVKLGGIGRNTVDEVIRFDEKFEEMPKLKSLIPEIDLSKLRVVANVAKEETDRTSHEIFRQKCAANNQKFRNYKIKSLAG